MSDFQLDKLDHQILSMVGDDARIPFLEVARICGVSGAAIHQRVTRLTRLGVLRGSHFDMNPEVLGYETIAFIGLYLKDVSTFDSVVAKLHKIPEIVECHYTTGGYDLFVKVYAKNNSHLLSLIHDKLQPLGLSRSETIISFREAIKRQIPVPKWNDEVEEDV